MTSLVNWVVLGLVIECAGYGAEIFKRYQRLYADVLPIRESSHIYAALNELVRRGYLREIPPPPGALARVGRQPKPGYCATQLGIRSFIDRLVEQAETERKRQALWVRQLGIFADSPVVALQVLGRFQSACLEQAGTYGKAAAGPVPEAREELTEHLFAKQQRFAGGGMLSWIKYTTAVFEARAGRIARDDTSRT